MTVTEPRVDDSPDSSIRAPSPRVQGQQHRYVGGERRKGPDDRCKPPGDVGVLGTMDSGHHELSCSKPKRSTRSATAATPAEMARDTADTTVLPVTSDTGIIDPFREELQPVQAGGGEAQISQ